MSQGTPKNAPTDTPTDTPKNPAKNLAKNVAKTPVKTASKNLAKDSARPAQRLPLQTMMQARRLALARTQVTAPGTQTKVLHVDPPRVDPVHFVQHGNASANSTGFGDNRVAWRK